MSTDGSVTGWIDRLKAGDHAAAQPLWERYFARLVGLARQRLEGQPRRAADEEDVALSAFTRFCLGAERGQFPRLEDRDDLWQLLVVLTTRKAVDQFRHEHRAKRGAGEVLGESALGHASDSSSRQAGFDQIMGSEPTPQFAALVAEEYRWLLERLPDDLLRSIALYKMEGYTSDEIAQKLSRTVRTVERKLQRIRIIWSAEVPG